MSLDMLWVIIRPDKKAEVIRRLAAEGFHALSETQVYGRGQQRGIQVGSVIYDELAKTMLLLSVERERTAQAVQAIQEAAHTGAPGDGKIFVQPVAAAYTVRTARPQP